MLLVVGVGLAAYFFLRPPRLHDDPMANVPLQATAVAHVNVRALREGTLWRRLVVGRGADQPLRALEDRCGFDPLERVHTVTAFVTGENADDLAHVVGIVRGPLDPEALAACVDQAGQQSGASLRRTEVEGLPAVAGASGDSRAVFVGRSAILLGAESSVTQTLRTIRDGKGSAADHALGLIFQDVAGRDVTIAARVPPHWRRAAQLYVGSTLANALSELDSIALGARVRRGLSVSARLVMRSGGAAAAATRAIRARLEDLQQTPMIGFTPFAAALRLVAVAHEGQIVTLAFDWSEERVGRMLDALDDLEALSGKSLSEVLEQL